MRDITDAVLLELFSRDESEEAFAELVRRHIALVYSVALRHTENPEHAQEITQAVFIILARKAASLVRKTVLSGWLYHTARLTAGAELARMLEATDARFDPAALEILRDTRKLCPKCERKMVLRTAGSGRGAGEKFWGCAWRIRN